MWGQKLEGGVGRPGGGGREHEILDRKMAVERLGII